MFDAVSVVKSVREVIIPLDQYFYYIFPCWCFCKAEAEIIYFWEIKQWKLLFGLFLVYSKKAEVEWIF